MEDGLQLALKYVNNSPNSANFDLSLRFLDFINIGYIDGYILAFPDKLWVRDLFHKGIFKCYPKNENW